MFTVQRILIPVDFSPGSDAALAAAMVLADKLGASITLLHVLEPPSFMELEERLPTPAITGATQAQAEQELRRVLYSVSSRERRGLEVVVREGEPSRVIIEAAKELGIDLIVMGTHGRTGLAHLLLGSIAERVLRGAHCPVLTVRLPERRAA